MLVDTKGLTQSLEGKSLRVLFRDGAEEVIKMESVEIFDCHESCNGFVYRLLSTQHPGKLRKRRTDSLYWAKFEDAVSWKVAEENESLS